MGILMSNIQHFAGLQMIPVSSLKPAFSGPHAALNYVVFVLQQLIFYSKTRGLLAMIFGAGALLLLQRVEARHGQRRANQIFVRRHLWMIVLGLLHAYFLWDGDFLAPYGAVAFVLLFACRRLSAKSLIVSGMLITLLPGTYALMSFHTGDLETMSLAARVTAAELDQRLGKPLSPSQAASISAWKQSMVPARASREVLEKKALDGQQRYSTRLHQKLSAFLRGEGVLISTVLFDSGGMALLGMGLLKTGFLTGKLPKKIYLWTASLGLLASFPLTVLGLWEVIRAGFPQPRVVLWIDLPLQFTRIGATLAFAALILLWVQSGWFKRVASAFNAVGRMALTNYLLTSAICQFVFAWGPWKLYGEVEYYQIFCVALGVWIVNLTLSILWLRHFAFGPVEWLWRSLTYGKIPPMILQDEVGRRTVA